MLISWWEGILLGPVRRETERKTTKGNKRETTYSFDNQRETNRFGGAPNEKEELQATFFTSELQVKIVANRRYQSVVGKSQEQNTPFVSKCGNPKILSVWFPTKQLQTFRPVSLKQTTHLWFICIHPIGSCQLPPCSNSPKPAGH